MTKHQTFEERFPLHAQVREIRSEHAAISEFFEWATGSGRIDMKESEIEQMIADFFMIDLVAFAAEKEDMISMIRSTQAGVASLDD